VQQVRFVAQQKLGRRLSISIGTKYVMGSMKLMKLTTTQMALGHAASPWGRRLMSVSAPSTVRLERLRAR
jgi:hypothetical protein